MNASQQKTVEVEDSESGEGRYLYCIASGTRERELEKTGVDGNSVYTIPYEDISAVVHACGDEGYEPEDEEEAKRMVFDHNYIVDKSTELFGTVLPFSFNSIVEGEDEDLREWMEDGYSELDGKLEELEGKSEYTVQIFCDESLLEPDTGEGAETEDMSKGMAYLQERKEEKEAKGRARIRMEESAKEFQEKIEKVVDNIRVEGKPKLLPEEWENKGKIILNASCLLPEAQEEDLGDLLGKIDDREEFTVRFTGPWAPFSFTEIQV